MRDELTRARRSSARSTRRERPLHCHHEKTIVIDDRVAFVGGIDLTSRPATASTRATIRRAPTSAGTTPRRGSKARRSATSPSTSGCAGTRSTGETLAAGRAQRARRATSSCRSCARSRSRSTTRCRAATSGFSSPTCARFQPAERFIYLENQFLWSPEIAAVLRDKLRRSAAHRLPDRASCCRRSRTAGDDDTRGVLGRADRRRRRRRAGARLHAVRALRARSPIPSTSTPRSGSSTTAG